MDLVTIIIPIYNIEVEYLKRCVASVYAQDYPRLEVLLVDDGSTDGTAEVCDGLVDNYSTTEAIVGHTIKAFHKSNGGSSSARNLGIKNAKGSYIGFVDSDDYIDSDFVSLMMDAIDKYHVPMAQISRDEIDIDGNKRPDVCIPPVSNLIITNKEQMIELLMHRGDCSFCTRITRKELFDGREFPEGKLNEDFYLLTQILDDVEEYVILPKQAYHVFYRIGSNSRKADSDDFSRVFIDIVDNADYIETLVADKYPDLKDMAKRFALFQRLDYMLHIPIGLMTSDNEFYQNVLGYLGKNFFNMIVNKHLTSKNKIYLTLLTFMPKCTRIIHKLLRSL